MTATFKTIAGVKRANKASGHFWFEPDTMRFFRCRVETELFAGRFFVSSEQQPASMDGTTHPRLYTIRKANADGSIDTVGDFQAYRTKAQAVKAMHELVSE